MKLKELRCTGDIIPDKEFLRFLKSRNETILSIPKLQQKSKDPLLDIEISLNRCSRLGVFRK